MVERLPRPITARERAEAHDDYLRTLDDDRDDDQLSAADVREIRSRATAAGIDLSGSGGDAGGIKALHGPRFDDIGNAERLWRARRHEVRYVPQWGTWLTYDAGAGRWREDPRDVRLLEYSKAVVDELWSEIPNLSDNDRRKALAAHARRSGNDHRLAAAVRLARGLPGIAVAPDHLDADPDLLNVANGTVDLRTGELRPHDPAQLLTRQTRAAYRPDADAPTWRAFLERILPDAEVRAFLQRAVGYTLTGRVTEHVLLVLLGSGANGKSTLVNALRHVTGDYSAIARRDLLIASQHGPHDAGRVVLQGRRLVAASEIERGAQLSEAEIKELTGGERIIARRLYGEAFEFDPTWTIWLSANHRPRVHGTDEAIWRRLRLIEFPVTIPPTERDTDLGDKLKAEADGILAWALAGHHQWRTDGLAEPAAVIIATAAYREHEDVVGRFLTDQDLVVDTDQPGLVTQSADLTRLLEAWCTENGVRLGRARLTEELQHRGAIRAKSNGKRIWRHLGPRDTQGHPFQESPDAHARREVADGPPLVSLPEPPPDHQPPPPEEPPPDDTYFDDWGATHP